jgi:hypothetical protein
MSKMPIKKQIYIIILISFVLSVILISVFVYPIIKEIKKDSQKIISYKNNIFLLETEFNEAKKFQTKYEKYKPNLDRLDQMLVDSKNPVDFIKYLEKISSDTETEIEISTPAFVPSTKSFTFAGLQIDCSGAFSNVLKFVNTLETGNYLAQVQNLSMTSYSQDVSDKKTITGVKATFLIKIFAK